MPIARTEVNHMTSETTVLVPTIRALPADRNPVAVYLASLPSTASRRTMAGALKTAADILAPEATATSLPWERLQYKHIARLRAELTRTRAPATARKIMCAVRRTLVEARRLGLLTTEACTAALDVPGIKLPAAPPAGRDLRDDELKRAFDTIKSKSSPMRERDACLLALLFGCGLRRAEVVGLDLSDYDQHAGKLIVHGKGGVTHEIYCRNEVRRAIDAWLQVRGTDAGSLLLHVDRHGIIRPGRLSTTSVYKRFARYLNASPHSARRTFVGRALDSGVDLATVQRLCGHASPTTTARYDRRDSRARERAAELVRLPM
jgi:integrase